MTRTAMCAAVVACAAMLAACGSDGVPGAGSGAGAANGATGAVRDPCRLVSANDITVTTGETVTKMESDLAAGPTLASCKFSVGDPSAALGGVVFVDEGRDYSRQRFDGMRPAANVIVPAPGIGDEAYFLRVTQDGGEIFVLTGSEEIHVNVAIQGLPNRDAIAQELATTALASLEAGR